MGSCLILALEDILDIVFAINSYKQYMCGGIGIRW